MILNTKELYHKKENNLSSNRNNKTSLLVTTALLTALVFICTILLRIPVGPDCYIHLGDAVIILSVLLLPIPYACFAGSIGASLADLIGGFAFWAPWTYVIKLLTVLVLGIFIDKQKKNASDKTFLGISTYEFFGLCIAGLVSVVGYFISELILFGNVVPAAACVPFNIIQVVIGAIIAELIYHRIK